MYNGEEFQFSGPIADFNLRYALGSKFNHDHQYEALVFNEQPFTFEINTSDMTLTGPTLADEAKEEISRTLKSNFVRIKSEIQDAKKELMLDFPMDLAVPFVFMFYATQFSQAIHFDDKFIQLDFSLQHLKLLKPKQLRLLKDIESQFYGETNPAGDDVLFQFHIDDNLFNSFFSVLTTIDKMFSSRDLAKMYPKAN